MKNPSEIWSDNRTEREFGVDGLPCCTRTNGSGHRCGYVKVPVGHPLHGKDYDEAESEYDILVDGGLTFSHVCDDGTVFGWDGGHGWHRRDTSIMSERLREFYKRHPDLLMNHDEPTAYMVTADLAEKETQKLAVQLAAIGRGEVVKYK